MKNGPSGKYGTIRCGLGATGQVEKGYCGREIKVQGWYMQGRLCTPTCCDACSLKYQVGKAETKIVRDDVALELAQLLACSVDEAKRRADAAFGTYKWTYQSKAKKGSTLIQDDD
jgi:hypothetical protein